MGMKDRLFTIIVTATLTSAAWVVAGTTVLRPSDEHAAFGPATPSTLLASGDQGGEGGGSGDAERAAGSRPPRAVQLPLGPGAWTIPVANVRASELVNTFEQSRAGGARVHNAIDIAAPVGTPVVAAAAGVVERLFLSEDGGKTVYIRTPDRRLVTYYAHLDAYAPDLREGMTVRRGQVLGTVGYSGNASPDAPHLHFAIWRSAPGRSVHDSGEVLNPYPLLTSR